MRNIFQNVWRYNNTFDKIKFLSVQHFHENYFYILTQNIFSPFFFYFTIYKLNICLSWSQLIITADVLSAVEFGPTGEYLATGDKGGRVVVFKQSARTKELAQAQGKVAYSFYTEFQSHEPEFDYLKSLEIEEKINCIRWCKNRGNGMFLLSTNDKTIKLWKIYEKNLVERNNFNLDEVRFFLYF